jgi:cytochrome bd ubiquinol oxidase subunit II
MGVIAGGLAIVGLIVLRADLASCSTTSRAASGWRAVIVSAAAGAFTVGLVGAGRYEPARVSAALAVAAIIAGWGLAQSPDLLPGLTVTEGAAADSTLEALLISIAAGLVILVPSLMLLYGLLLRGRFDPGAAAVEEHHEPVPLREARPLVLAAAALLVAGVPLTFLGDGILLGVGVAALALFVVTGALALLRPDALDA